MGDPGTLTHCTKYPGTESLKAANTANAVWETFSIYGEHFGPKFTLFCRIFSFVANYSLLTVFKSRFLIFNVTFFNFCFRGCSYIT